MAGTHIDLLGLRKTFGSKQVLRGLDLTINAGEFVAVVGHSGCGKSTLLRLIAGLAEPSDGAVVIDKQDLKGLNRACRVMFQDARLLPWKRARDNVGIGASGNGQQAAATMMAQVGLAGRENEWPAGFSGGEKQRLALARALVHQPSLLLLDEPLSALDALTRIEMQQLIEALWQKHGFTALLITHDVDEAVALADRVVLLEQGRVSFEQQVGLPRPRERTSPAFSKIRGEILGRVLSENRQQLAPARYA